MAVPTRTIVEPAAASELENDALMPEIKVLGIPTKFVRALTEDGKRRARRVA